MINIKTSKLQPFINSVLELKVYKRQMLLEYDSSLYNGNILKHFYIKLHISFFVYISFETNTISNVISKQCAFSKNFCFAKFMDFASLNALCNIKISELTKIYDVFLHMLYCSIYYFIFYFYVKRKK